MIQLEFLVECLGGLRHMLSDAGDPLVRSAIVVCVGMTPMNVLILKVVCDAVGIAGRYLGEIS